MNSKYDLTKSPLYRLRNKRKLAEYLGVPPDYFRVFRVYRYDEFSKPKPNGDGTREFKNPENELKLIQKKICNLLQRIYLPSWVKSAKEGESYITNCKEHTNSDYVLTMDISKFYDSASRKMIYGLFLEIFCMSNDIVTIMTNLIMHNNCLPTGGPASQIVVFYAYKEMFEKIHNLAEDNNCIFTLYVDDMTFSSNMPISHSLRNKVAEILKSYNLMAKNSKDHYYTKKRYKEVTGVGITKDGKLTLPNSRRNEIRKKFMECKVSKNLKDIESLKGMLCSARQIEPDIFPTIAGLVKKYDKELKKLSKARSKKYGYEKNKRRTQIEPIPVN